MVCENWFTYWPEETAASTARTAVVRAAWSIHFLRRASASAAVSLSTGIAISEILPPGGLALIGRDGNAALPFAGGRRAMRPRPRRVHRGVRRGARGESGGGRRGAG